jgi:hypothetical protein
MQSSFNLQIRQLDVNRYMVKFINTSWHIPDLPVQELNQNPKIEFAGTRRPDLDKPVVEMEIHMNRVADVAEELRQASDKQELKLRDLSQLLDRAFMSYVA